MNRRIGVAYSGANFDGANKYFVYDSATVNGVVMSNTGGRLAEAYTSSTFGGTKIIDTGISYTVRGEKSDIYEMTPKSGEYYHTNATYFANGLLSTLSDVVGGVTWTYTPDGKGRPYSAIQNPSTNLVSSTTYNAANEPCVVTLGLGDTDTYLYDGVSCTGLLTTGRMTSYTFSVGATPKTDVGSLTWNANGTLRSLGITDGFSTGGTQTCNYGTSTTVGYDEQGRLVSSVCANSGGTNVWGQQFSYDAFQNLTKTVPNGDTGVTWSPGYHQTNNQAIGFSYDSNGNLLSDGTNSYTWNQDNHPVTVNSSPATYDAFGNMAENKTDSTALLEELPSPIGNIGIMKKSAVTEYRIPLPGGDTYSVASSNLIWHRDWLGSVRLTSNISNRNYVADMSFAPYGEIYLGFGSTANLNFTGDNQDLISGDFDTPNRELLPTEGRWLSPDPARASWNAYSYTTNPLGEMDASGLYQQPFTYMGYSTNGYRNPLNVSIGGGFAGNPDAQVAPVMTGSSMGGDVDLLWDPNFANEERAAFMSRGPGVAQAGPVELPIMSLNPYQGMDDQDNVDFYSTGITLTSTVWGWPIDASATLEPPISRLIKDLIQRPWSGGILIPLVPIPAGPAFSIAIDPTKGFAVLSLGFGVGLRGANAGPLWGNTANSYQVLSGPSVTGTISPGPVGVQRIENLNGALYGPTFGSPGISLAVGWGFCFGNCQ